MFCHRQFGDDPRRGDYPLAFRGLYVPSDRFGSYNSPGWTGNGLGTFPDGSAAGVEEDPIGAEGMLFFKGWQLLTMAFYTRVSGDDETYLNRPWLQAAVGGKTTQWTMRRAAARLNRQWRQREAGLH